MHEGQIFVIVVIAVVTAGVTLGTIAQAWARTRMRGQSKIPPQQLDAIDARLARMEEMIEGVAIEMERVAEGQRFTAKLLADRASSAPPLPTRQVPAAEGRIPTPR